MRQFSRTRGTEFEAELGDDMVLLSPGESSMVVSAANFQRWRKAEIDDDVLVMNTDSSQVVQIDNIHYVPQVLPHSINTRIFDDEFRSTSSHVRSNHDLQYLLDQLPAPGAEENSALSDGSSFFHSSDPRAEEYAEEYITAPPLRAQVGNWHFSAPAEENVSTQHEFHRSVESGPGLKNVEELRVLVRAREREVGEERAKTEKLERACEEVQLEVSLL